MRRLSNMCRTAMRSKFAPPNATPFMADFEEKETNDLVDRNR